MLQGHRGLRLSGSGEVATAWPCVCHGGCWPLRDFDFYSEQQQQLSWLRLGGKKWTDSGSFCTVLCLSRENFNCSADYMCSSMICLLSIPQVPRGALHRLPCSWSSLLLPPRHNSVPHSFSLPNLGGRFFSTLLLSHPFV